SDHGLATGPGYVRVTHRIADRVFQPLARGVVADIDLQNGWQPAKEDLAKLRLASHVAANELGDFPASAHAGGFEALGRYSFQLLRHVRRLDARTVSHEVGIAMGKNYDVSCA